MQIEVSSVTFLNFPFTTTPFKETATLARSYCVASLAKPGEKKIAGIDIIVFVCQAFFPIAIFFFSFSQAACIAWMGQCLIVCLLDTTWSECHFAVCETSQVHLHLFQSHWIYRSGEAVCSKLTPPSPF